MKRIIMIMVVTLALAVLAFARSRTAQTQSNSQYFHAEAIRKSRTCGNGVQGGRKDKIAEQDRINRYFQREVISKLRDCWKGVQGEGTIEMKFTYTKAGGNWTWDKLGVNRSTLPRGQDAVALRCMQDAVRSTSFAIEEDDLRGGSIAAMKFDIHWSFPVPLPTNATEFAEFRKKPSGGKGGCDGYGSPPKCIPDCSDPNDPSGPIICRSEKVCIGVAECTIDALGTCTTSPCTGGGVFGGSGNVIIF